MHFVRSGENSDWLWGCRIDVQILGSVSGQIIAYNSTQSCLSGSSHEVAGFVAALEDPQCMEDASTSLRVRVRCIYASAHVYSVDA